MSNFLERLKEEKSQLDERVMKLQMYLDEQKHKELAVEMQILLSVQCKAMKVYQEILEARLFLIEG